MGSTTIKARQGASRLVRQKVGYFRLHEIPRYKGKSRRGGCSAVTGSTCFVGGKTTIRAGVGSLLDRRRRHDGGAEKER